MELLLASGSATASELQQKLEPAASYSAVRAILRVLEEKGIVTHEYDGPRYLYRPAIAVGRAKKTLLRQVLDTFFEGSREQLVAALLDTDERKITKDELDKLSQLIEEARRKER